MGFYFFAVDWQQQSWQVSGSPLALQGSAWQFWVLGVCKEGGGGLLHRGNGERKILENANVCSCFLIVCIKVVLCVGLEWDYLCGNGYSFILRQC